MRRLRGKDSTTPRLEPEDLGFGPLFERVSDAIVVVEAASNRIVLWNPAATKLFGYGKEEAIGQPFDMLLAEDRRPSADGGRPLELPARLKGGQPAWIELTLSRMACASRPGDYMLAIIRDISERKRWEATTAASEQKWRTLVDNAPQIITIVDREGRIQFINRLVRSRSLSELVGKDSADYLMPEDRGWVRALHDEVWRTGRPASFVVNAVLADGTRRWYQMSLGAIVHDGETVGLMAIATDIDRLKRTETLLAEAQRLGHIGSWERDLASDRAVWSDETFRIYGVSPERFDGRFQSFLSLVHPEDRAALTGMLARALEQGGTFTAQHRIVRPDGSERKIFSRIEIVTNAAGKPVTMRGISQDITELTEAYSELARRTEEVQRLQELDHLKTNFVHSVSHELRTPLTSILGFAEFLEDELGGELTPQQREYVLEIETGVRRLERLVDDLLDFARIESGTFKLTCSEADLGERAREVVASLQPQARQARLTLALHAPETPLVFRMDPQRVGQVLINLINNALKFTAAEGRVDVTIIDEGDRVRCEVADTGTGIAPEDLPKLFRRFSQLGNAQRKGGSGLGLSISKLLVEAHEGTIGVGSRLGAGSTFWFTLPKHGACDGPADGT